MDIVTLAEMLYQPTIQIEKLHPDVVTPNRATELSAGYDVRAYLEGREVAVYWGSNYKAIHRVDREGAPTVTLLPGERAMIPTGFKATLPPGYEAQVRPRSGSALKVGLYILNSPGTIDADFPHEWMVLVTNGSSVPLVIDHQEKIAQIVLARYEVLDWAEGSVEQTTDRIGGFGSTGVKNV